MKRLWQTMSHTVNKVKQDIAAVTGLVSGFVLGHGAADMQQRAFSPSPVLPVGPDRPWLAPLAGFSDLPFRLLCRELGAAVACTEMISAKGLVLGQGRRSGATDELLATVPADSPLVVQLFGAEPDFLEKAVLILKDRGYVWFDLNMGCSVPKVGKSGAGSAMLRDPDNAEAAARAMLRAAGPGRVGFKLRLGWQAGEEVYLSLAKRLCDAGAGWLTLHPRYAKQGFSGRADHAATAALVRVVSVPVLASGDLFSAADGACVLRETGAAGLMFARGAVQNPAVFGELTALLKGAGAPPGTAAACGAAQISGPIASGAQDAPPSVILEGMAAAPQGRGGESPALLCEEMSRSFAPAACGAAQISGPIASGAQDAPPSVILEGIIRRHADLIRRFYPVRHNRNGVEAGLLKMRTFVPRYVKRCAGARALRRALVGCESWDGLDGLLTEFFADASATAPLEEEA